MFELVQQVAWCTAQRHWALLNWGITGPKMEVVPKTCFRTIQKTICANKERNVRNSKMLAITSFVCLRKVWWPHFRLSVQNVHYSPEMHECLALMIQCSSNFWLAEQFWNSRSFKNATDMEQLLSRSHWSRNTLKVWKQPWSLGSLEAPGPWEEVGAGPHFPGQCWEHDLLQILWVGGWVSRGTWVIPNPLEWSHCHCTTQDLHSSPSPISPESLPTIIWKTIFSKQWSHLYIFVDKCTAIVLIEHCLFHLSFSQDRTGTVLHGEIVPVLYPTWKYSSFSIT